MKISEDEWIRIVSEFERNIATTMEALSFSSDNNTSDKVMCCWRHYISDESLWTFDYEFKHNAECKSAILQAEKLNALKAVIEAIDDV